MPLRCSPLDRLLHRRPRRHHPHCRGRNDLQGLGEVLHRDHCTLRIGYCIVCLVKVLTGMSVSFLAEFLYATAADMPSDIKWAARCVRTKRMRLASYSLATCFRAVAGIASAGVYTSTHA